MAKNQPINSRRNYLLGVIIFIVLFTSLSHWFVKHDKDLMVEQFNNHAAVITNDLWVLNKDAIKAYLQLVVQTNKYKYLRVMLEKDTFYLDVPAPPLSFIDTILQATGLLPLTRMSASIHYKGLFIGTLQGEQYCATIYPLFNIFIFLQLILFITLYILNISGNRKRLEQEVQERTKKYRDSEQRFHDLINLLPEIVYETDDQGILIYVNKISLKKFGFSGSDIQNRSCFDLVVEEHRERARSNFSVLLQGQELPLQEFTALAADGSTFPVLVRSAPMYNGLTVCGVRSIIIDITDRAALEQKLRNAQRMEVIGLMASGVAHDLNNILSGLINYPELILQRLPADSPVMPQVRAIKKSGLRAAEIVTDLLTVARGAAATKVIANPNALIRDYMNSPEFSQLQLQFPNISWQLELDEDISNILCSQSHIKKSLMNLVVNASEAIAGEGQVTLTSRSLLKENQDKQQIVKHWSVISVSDTGPGISPKDQEHIFEPFYTKKIMEKSGTGLGLTVVWNTIRDHEGEIQLHSDEHGTTISLYFPASEEKVTLPQATDTPVSQYSGNGEKILVIDDDPQLRDIALQVLASLNYTVSVAASGEEAVEYLRTRAVQLLLLDMLMPPGINGLQTYQQILAIHPKQKAIIVSGFSDSEEVDATMQMGAIAFIKKPYNIDQLARTIHETLN